MPFGARLTPGSGVLRCGVSRSALTSAAFALAASLLACIEGQDLGSHGASPAVDGGDGDRDAAAAAAPDAASADDATARDASPADARATEGGAQRDATSDADGAPGLVDAASDAPEDAAPTVVDRRAAQWLLPPPSPPGDNYVAGADTVLDKTTGLVWERSPSSALRSWDEAATACAALRLGGQRDWRVPTRIELLSLLDYGREPGPLLGPPTFAELPAGSKVTWTASAAEPSAVTSDPRFTVDVATGDVNYDGALVSHLVRCVRAGAAAASPRWTPLGGGIVRDNHTGLEWQTAPLTFPVPSRPRMGTLAEAQSGCAALPANGGRAFRVPTVRELHTVVDEESGAKGTGYLDPVFDQAVSRLDLWSATTLPSQPTRAYVLGLGFGVSSSGSTSAWHGAFCVR